MTSLRGLRVARQRSVGARRSVTVMAAVFSAAADAGVVSASGEASGSGSLVAVMQRVSVTSRDARANGVSDQPAISADGADVAHIPSLHLVPRDTDNRRDMFVR